MSVHALRPHKDSAVRRPDVGRTRRRIDGFRMAQKVRLMEAMKRVSGGVEPWSDVMEDVAMLFTLTSGSRPANFVHVCRSRPASVREAREKPCSSRSGTM